jgi:hypothetical protein
MAGYVERPHDSAALRIEGADAVAGGEPDMPAVKRDASHFLNAWKWPVFPEDFGWSFDG